VKKMLTKRGEDDSEETEEWGEEKGKRRRE